MKKQNLFLIVESNGLFVDFFLMFPQLIIVTKNQLIELNISIYLD